MRELLITLAQALVARPERVRVSREDAGDEMLLRLSVAPEDRGRVIGRNGRTVDALRTVLDAVARCHGGRCQVEIGE